MSVELPSYGSEPPQPTVFADTLARLLGQIEGVHLTGITVTPSTVTDLRAAAQGLGASYVVTAAIVEASSVLTAKLTLIMVATGAQVATEFVETG